MSSLALQTPFLHILWHNLHNMQVHTATICIQCMHARLHCVCVCVCTPPPYLLFTIPTPCSSFSPTDRLVYHLTWSMLPPPLNSPLPNPPLCPLDDIFKCSTYLSSVLNINSKQVCVHCPTEQSIKERQENIVSAREDLKEAKEIRKNRQQYDALAKVIQRHPERTRTQNEIKELQEEMERLKTSREKLISKV